MEGLKRRVGESQSAKMAGNRSCKRINSGRDGRRKKGRSHFHAYQRPANVHSRPVKCKVTVGGDGGRRPVLSSLLAASIDPTP